MLGSPAPIIVCIGAAPSPGAPCRGTLKYTCRIRRLTKVKSTNWIPSHGPTTGRSREFAYLLREKGDERVAKQDSSVVHVQAVLAHSLDALALVVSANKHTHRWESTCSVYVFLSGSQCVKNLAPDLSTSTLGTLKAITYGNGKVPNVRVWRRATGNGPWTMDKSQTPTSYV
jgi:hypothetical protein